MSIDAEASSVAVFSFLSDIQNRVFRFNRSLADAYPDKPHSHAFAFPGTDKKGNVHPNKFEVDIELKVSSDHLLVWNYALEFHDGFWKISGLIAWSEGGTLYNLPARQGQRFMELQSSGKLLGAFDELLTKMDIADPEIRRLS